MAELMNSLLYTELAGREAANQRLRDDYLRQRQEQGAAGNFIYDAGQQAMERTAREEAERKMEAATAGKNVVLAGQQKQWQPAEDVQTSYQEGNLAGYAQQNTSDAAMMAKMALAQMQERGKNDRARTMAGNRPDQIELMKFRWAQLAASKEKDALGAQIQQADILAHEIANPVSRYVDPDFNDKDLALDGTLGTIQQRIDMLSRPASGSRAPAQRTTPPAAQTPGGSGAGNPSSAADPLFGGINWK